MAMFTKDFKQFATQHKRNNPDAVTQYIQEQMRNMTRTVIEERPHPFREVDVFSQLIKNRIIFFGMPVDSQTANVVNAQLLYLESVAPEKEITLYINSPGGSVYDGLAIYDTMQYISSPVSTVCIGLAASMAAVLLAGGVKGQRASLHHSRIMIHQPMGQTKGPMSDMEIAVEQITAVSDDIYKILAHHTEQPLEVIRRDANRDFWLRGKEAQAYGLVDEIFHKKPIKSTKS